MDQKQMIRKLATVCDFLLTEYQMALDEDEVWERSADHVKQKIDKEITEHIELVKDVVKALEG